MKPSVLTIALSFVGAVVGAGFISGQELVQFFLRFQLWGIVGWIITIIIVSVGAGYFLKKIATAKPESFNEVVNQNFNGVQASLVKAVINGYLIGGLVIMISGASNLLTNFFNWPLFIVPT